MSKSRGFVTIATGKEQYFVLAKNLLYSYRQFAAEKYPFAIICDRENKYTEEFDDVIVLRQAHCNYLGKLHLYEYLPYDETIFIDADSLAYGNLDVWWHIFSQADDFSLFGYAWLDLKSGKGWFIPDGIKEFKDKVSFIPDFNGGVYYLRRGKRCAQVFKLANHFAKHYQEYSFTDFKTPADEPCLALAMAVYHCKPVDLPEFVFAPPMECLDADISIPKAHFFKDKGRDYDVRLIHWSNYRTKQSFYKFETEKLMHMKNGKTDSRMYRFLYTRKVKYYLLRMGDVGVFCVRVIKKMKKIAEYIGKK